MEIILWHRHRAPAERDILSRAAQRGRRRRRTVWWDIAYCLLLAAYPAMWAAMPWLGDLPVLRALFPVTLSVWELEKLLFWPTALIAVMRWVFTGDLLRGVVTSYAAALLPAMVLFWMALYTAVGMAGTSLPALAAAYLPAAAVAVWRFWRIAGRQRRSGTIGAVIFLLLAAGSVWMTEHAPDMAIFRSL